MKISSVPERNRENPTRNQETARKLVLSLVFGCGWGVAGCATTTQPMVDNTVVDKTVAGMAAPCPDRLKTNVGMPELRYVEPVIFNKEKLAGYEISPAVDKIPLLRQALDPNSDTTEFAACCYATECSKMKIVPLPASTTRSDIPPRNQPATAVSQQQFIPCDDYILVNEKKHRLNNVEYMGYVTSEQEWWFDMEYGPPYGNSDWSVYRTIWDIDPNGITFIGCYYHGVSTPRLTLLPAGIRHCVVRYSESSENVYCSKKPYAYDYKYTLD